MSQPDAAPAPSSSRRRRWVAPLIAVAIIAALAVVAVVVWGGESEPSGCDDYAALIERIDAGGQEGQSEETITDLEAIALAGEDSSDAQVSEAATALSRDIAGFRRDGGSNTLPISISELAEACELDPSAVFTPPDV